MSHTHAGANTNSRLERKPGTELIAPYLEHLAEQVGDAVLEARATAARGLRHLRLRPLRPGDEPGLSGTRRRSVRLRLQPRGAADDTLLVARVDRREGDVARRCSTTPATRPRSPGTTIFSRPTTSARRVRCSRRRSTPRRSSSRAPRVISRRATTTSATRPSPTATAASSATPRRPRSRPSPSRDPLRLHGDRRVGRESRHLGVPALRAEQLVAGSRSRPC